MTQSADRERAMKIAKAHLDGGAYAAPDKDNVYRAYIEVVGELKGKDEQIVGMRNEIIRRVDAHDKLFAENERLRALLLAVQSLVCPIRSDGFYQESIANLLADEGEK